MRLFAAIDLGGTHCRFAKFRETPRRLELEAVEQCATAELKRTESVLEKWEQTLHTKLSAVDALVLGVAGPVRDPLHARLSNAPLEIDLRNAASRFGIKTCCVVNDFVCEAYACLTPAGERSLPVLGTELPLLLAAESEAVPVAVLGSGTGLGTSWLVPYRDAGKQRWRALPAEAGHMAFAFVGREEEEFAAFARKQTGQVLLRGDDLVTGRGVALLHHFLTGRVLSPEQAAAEGLNSACATQCWYARFLGRVCAHWGLCTLCFGGLFLTGGMVRRNPAVLAHPAFAEGFFMAPGLEVLERIPVRRCVDPYSGLWGAAWLAAHGRS
ncbi:glucokinase [uncultured Mailhella sp.]|uniref:glucokinase n=1 Tax=uncultured Mailhella sp. TaxID=1981031 RepID=UPI0026096493|nr:glucokinase [uncultured Mailhella sp.]